jgi:hypothetical protein
MSVAFVLPLVAPHCHCQCHDIAITNAIVMAAQPRRPYPGGPPNALPT